MVMPSYIAQGGWRVTGIAHGLTKGGLSSQAAPGVMGGCDGDDSLSSATLRRLRRGGRSVY